MMGESRRQSLGHVSITHRRAREAYVAVIAVLLTVSNKVAPVRPAAGFSGPSLGAALTCPYASVKPVREALSSPALYSQGDEGPEKPRD